MKKVYSVVLAMLCALTTLVVAGQEANLDSGLVGWWSFNEGSGSIACDSSSNGNNGTIAGAQWVNGKQSKALSFDGINDSVLVPDAAELDITGDISLVAWIWADSMMYCAPIVAKGDSVSNYNYYMAIGEAFGNRATVQLRDTSYPGDDLELRSKQLIDIKTWRHIVGVRQGDTMRLFINAVLDTSGVYSGNPLWVNNLPLTIGSYPYSDPWYFKGKIDELRIYNRALTQKEILALSVRCGDANGDLVVNSGDAVYIINYLFKGGPAPNPQEAGDANCEGSVNEGDAVYIINNVFKGGPAPICPN